MEPLTDLFTPVTRDERQNEAVSKWMQAKGRATIVAGTGVGSQKTGTACIVS